ncbi:hypothetical protein M422DRAFT_31928 [Sphaerobolus stellatus SS14]|uniref:Unplaced genomic scaffold SPHSTscaffold_344, whole genome shotgun sequence n=1 Tax=Sphaerobolus stellatus (strain SS14) TaxID=990650 RepID=A0A0C9UJ08_SPHS4|nr:hypothetical protein M422DRAFT_38799 [Sphaerobolus stellatus SS14]KIJ41042.1 hypothetical protein M422DRAFT_31928 [Sphaerobolus stellatus SS14]
MQNVQETAYFNRVFPRAEGPPSVSVPYSDVRSQIEQPQTLAQQPNPPNQYIQSPIGRQSFWLNSQWQAPGMAIQIPHFNHPQAGYMMHQPPLSAPHAPYPSNHFATVGTHAGNNYPMQQYYAAANDVPRAPEHQFSLQQQPQWNTQDATVAHIYGQRQIVVPNGVYHNVAVPAHITMPTFVEAATVNDQNASASVEAGTEDPSGSVQSADIAGNANDFPNSPYSGHSTRGMTPATASGRSIDGHDEESMKALDEEFRELKRRLGLNDDDGESIWQDTPDVNGLIAALAPNFDPVAGSSGATI